MQKVLILVLSYNQPPFSDLMEAQKKSWASLYHEDITTVFYYGGNGKDEVVNAYTKDEKILHSDFKFNITDRYYLMAGKFRKALKVARYMNWDHIFRTNSSSYINYTNLLKVADTLPKEKLYQGWTIEDSNHDGGLAVSGAGIWLSRDCAEILEKEINPDEEREEDVMIGRILRPHGITAVDDRSRVDYPAYGVDRILSAYHIRFKNQNRNLDAQNMINVHKKILNG